MSSEWKSEGVHRIAVERERQMGEEGFGAERDDAYRHEELARAAAAYAVAAANSYLADDLWPWNDMTFWKPSADPVRNLEKAGALIAAEIDRLLRNGH